MSKPKLHCRPVHSDGLSDLPEPLLLHILSFLPTKSALRISLLSRRFRHLWTASPCLHLDRADFPPGGRAFTSAVSRCLRLRDPSAPLLAFTLISWRPLAVKTATKWLARAFSLGLRDLNLDINADDFFSLLPLILTFPSLRCLRISNPNFYWPASRHSIIPANFLASGITNLHLKVYISCSDLQQLVMAQTQLQDLYLEPLSKRESYDLVSATVQNAKLLFNSTLPGVNLSFPALVVLDLTISMGSIIKWFHAEMPLLRKADIKIRSLCEEHVPVMGDLLRSLINVSQLSIHIQSAYPMKPDPMSRLSAKRRNQLKNRQFHMLVESGKDLPTFPQLRSLKLLMHFHEDSLFDFICFLQKAPVLDSVELHHVDNYEHTAVEEGRWKSQLPQDSEGNNQYAHFSNLHLGDKKIELMAFLLLAPCNE